MGIAVADITALKAIDTSLYSDGILASVVTLLDVFILNKNSTLTADDITVATTLSGTGRWIRQNIGNKQWATQTEWYINSSTGSDEAAGGAATPIKTISEWYRRIGKCEIGVDSVIYVINDLPDTDIVAGAITFTKGGSLLITGEKGITPVLSSSFSSVTTIDPTNNQPWEITDSSLSTNNFWSSYVSTSVAGHRLRIDGGTRNNAISWVAKDLGTKNARISQPIIAHATTPWLSSMASIQTGDNYVIELLPAICGFSPVIRIPSATGATTPGFRIKDLAFKPITGLVPAEPGGQNVGQNNSSAFYYSTNFVMSGCDARIIPNGPQMFLNCKFTRFNHTFSNKASSTLLGGLYLGPTTHNDQTSWVKLSKFMVDFRFMIQRGGVYVIDTAGDNAFIASMQAYDAPTYHGLAVETAATATFIAVLGNKEFFGSGHTAQAIRLYRGSRLYYFPDTTGLTMTSNSGNIIALGQGSTAPINFRNYSDLPLIEIDKETINGVPRVMAHTYFVKAN